MSLTAVLLCGGESQRMGRNKATIDWGGRPLWQVQLEKLRELAPDKILLSARAEPEWRPADVDLVIDGAPSRGPLSGLAAALSTCSTDHLLVLAIDLPHLRASQLRWIAGLVAPGVGVAPVINDRIQPLAAVYPRESAQFFRDALDSREYFSLQPLIRELVDAGRMRLINVASSDRELYKNVNTPEDLMHPSL